MKKVFFGLLFLATLFSSCSKKVDLMQDKKVEFAKDKSFDFLAKNLAISLQDKSILKFIHKEAIKIEDGDYDVLLAKIKNQSIEVNSENKIVQKTFKEAILGNSSSTNSRNLNNYLDSLNLAYPLLQIAIPEQEGMVTENLNLDEVDPWVVVLPPDLDDQIVTELKAYNTQGEEFWISALEQPNHLVIVVGESERITALPNDNDPYMSGNKSVTRSGCDYPSPMFQGSEYNYYLNDAINDYLICTNSPIVMTDSGAVGGGGLGSGGPVPQTCERDARYEYDEIVKVRFSTIEAMRAAEPWYKGRIELYCIISFGAPQPEGFNTLRKNFTRNRMDYGYEGKVEWVLANTETVMWAPNQLGDRICFRWYEEDGGRELNIKLGFTVAFPGGNNVTGEANYKINKKDDVLGESWVYYCSKANGTATEGPQFSTKDILFQVRER